MVFDSLFQVVEFDPCKVCGDIKDKDIQLQNTAEGDLDALDKLFICEDDIKIQGTAEDDLDALDELYSHTHDNMEKKCENILVGDVVEYDSSGTQAGPALNTKEERFDYKLDQTIHKEILSEGMQNSEENEAHIIREKKLFHGASSRQECCNIGEMNDTDFNRTSDILTEDIEEQQQTGIGALPKPTASSSRKQHTCEVCCKSFGSSYNLKRHKMVHSGTKCNSAQQTCEVCFKSFGSPYHLNRHKIVHSRDEQYSCKYCNIYFREAYQLRKQLKNCKSINLRNMSTYFRLRFGLVN